MPAALRHPRPSNCSKLCAASARSEKSRRPPWAHGRLAAMRRQGCGETSPRRFSHTMPGSPKRTWCPKPLLAKSGSLRRHPADGKGGTRPPVAAVANKAAPIVRYWCYAAKARLSLRHDRAQFAWCCKADDYRLCRSCT